MTTSNEGVQSFTSACPECERLHAALADLEAIHKDCVDGESYAAACKELAETRRRLESCEVHLGHARDGIKDRDKHRGRLLAALAEARALLDAATFTQLCVLCGGHSRSLRGTGQRIAACECEPTAPTPGAQTTKGD